MFCWCMRESFLRAPAGARRGITQNSNEFGGEALSRIDFPGSFDPYFDAGPSISFINNMLLERNLACCFTENETDSWTDSLPSSWASMQVHTRR
mmetsp:Transcript_3746/g.7719  ORF Transcript_3746/g.7719 Transcript_3746/m.7719 type:complete len:94 (-) Transcript_3746:134-415(-)